MGIDPGLTRTGYAVVDRAGGRLRPVAFGALRTSPGLSTSARLAGLAAEIAELLAAHRPDAASVERVFFNRNVRTAMAVGQASGVVLARTAEAGVPVTTYTPTEVKQSVVGYGGASKHQVQSMVASLLQLRAPPEPADAADACALAICHLNRGRLVEAIGRALA